MYKPISQYEITHMENLMVRDDCWDGYNDEYVRYCDIYSCSECPRYGDDCGGHRCEVWEYDGFEYFGKTEPSKRKLCCTCKHRTPHVAYDI